MACSQSSLLYVLLLTPRDNASNSSPRLFSSSPPLLPLGSCRTTAGDSGKTPQEPQKTLGGSLAGRQRLDLLTCRRLWRAPVSTSMTFSLVPQGQNMNFPSRFIWKRRNGNQGRLQSRETGHSQSRPSLPRYLDSPSFVERLHLPRHGVAGRKRETRARRRLKQSCGGP